jgi:glycosyltransferase involved in cell wall biosynthesis
MPYHITFVPTNSSHVAKLRPLMDALAARGHAVHLVATDAVSVPIHANLAHVQSTGYPYQRLAVDGFRPGQRSLGQWWQRGRLVRAIRRLLEEQPTDAVIFGSDCGEVAWPFVRVARNLGVPTVLIPDGVTLPLNPQFRQSWWQWLRYEGTDCLRKMTGLSRARGASGVDLILAMHELGLGAFLPLGVPRERIRVVGSCEYEVLAPQLWAPLLSEEEQALRRRLGLPPEKPVVLFSHQYLGGTEVERGLVATMVAGARRCGACLLVKLHPRGEEYPPAWRAWAGEQGMDAAEVVFVRDECTSVESVRLCAACVTAYSTVALEAWMAGKPVVLIQYLNVQHLMPYGELYGAALDAHSPGELEQAIVGVVRDAGLRDRLNRNAEKALVPEVGLDGRVVERMIEAIVGLIERRQSEDRG